jgi:hypothetical protein
LKIADAKITILFNDHGLHIELYDGDACIQFCKIDLDEKQTVEALSRIANTPCTIDVHGLQNVGKTRLMEQITFPIPKHEWGKKHDVAREEAKKHTPEGWTVPTYFGGQDSFFTKGEQEYARGTMVKWVNK